MWCSWARQVHAWEQPPITRLTVVDIHRRPQKAEQLCCRTVDPITPHTLSHVRRSVTSTGAVFAVFSTKICFRGGGQGVLSQQVLSRKSPCPPGPIDWPQAPSNDILVLVALIRPLPGQLCPPFAASLTRLTCGHPQAPSDGADAR
jgi:hypothetical protein